MGSLGLSLLFLAVDCVSSLELESVLVSSSGLELVDFSDTLGGSLDSPDSLDSVSAGESGLGSSMDSAFGFYFM